MFFAVKLGSIVELMKKVRRLNVLWWKSLRLERLYGGIYTLWSPLQPKERPLWQCRWGPVFLHPVLISKGRLAAGYLNSHGEVRRRSFVPGSCWVAGLRSIASNFHIRWRKERAAGGQRLASLLLDQQKRALIGE
jgi:hypothetical protein